MGWQAAPSKIESQWHGNRLCLICQTRAAFNTFTLLLTVSCCSHMGNVYVCVWVCVCYKDCVRHMTYNGEGVWAVKSLLLVYSCLCVCVCVRVCVGDHLFALLSRLQLKIDLIYQPKPGVWDNVKFEVSLTDYKKRRKKDWGKWRAKEEEEEEEEKEEEETIVLKRFELFELLTYVNSLHQKPPFFPIYNILNSG